MGSPDPLRTALVACALAGALAFTHMTALTASAPPRLDAIPVAVAGYVASPAPPLDPESARVLAADLYLHRYYARPTDTIEMDVAYYTQPRVGANMHSPLNCLPGNGWQVDDVRSAQVTAAGRTWPVRDTVVERRGTRFALTYWFQSRNRVLGDEWSTRFYLLADAVRRNPTDAGIVRLMMPASGDASAERATLASFAARLIPEIAARLAPG
jgi:EpsI family protein